MKKDLQYYMGLLYKTEIVEVPEDEGGGVILCHPELGVSSANAWGESYEEARMTLLEIKQGIFERCLEERVPIPEPADETLQEYSGKLLLRMPKMMHQTIARKARANDISINACIVQLLTGALARDEMKAEIAVQVEAGIRKALTSLSRGDRIHRVGTSKPRG